MEWDLRIYQSLIKASWRNKVGGSYYIWNPLSIRVLKENTSQQQISWQPRLKDIHHMAGDRFCLEENY